MGNSSSTPKQSYNKGLTARLRETSPWDTQTIESLLSQGADPNAPRQGDKAPPLVAAATVGCIPTMEVLVRYGADPNHFSGPKFHETPLLAAVGEGHTDAVEFLLGHGASINGTLRTGPPLMVTFMTKDLKMLALLLDRGADPNKKLLGTIRPTLGAEGALRCTRHDIRKLPKDGCAKCKDRLLLIQILALLRQHGGRPIVAGSSKGTGLIDAYIDLIAHVEKWEQRGENAAEWLGDITFNDPTIRAMMTAMIGAGLGQIGIPTPITSLEGALAADADGA